MHKLQIYTESEIGPSIKFQMSCDKCNRLEEREIADGPSDWNSHYEYKCLELGRKFNEDGLPVAFSDCPFINTEKANVILDAIESYVKI